MNVTLGEELKLHSDQSGVPAGYVRAANGVQYKLSDTGAAIKPETAAVEGPRIIDHLESTNQETGEVRSQDRIIDSENNELARYVTITDSGGNLISEEKYGNVALLGVEPDPFPLMPLILGAGVIASAYFIFKG